MLPLITESSWLPGYGRSKTSMSIPKRTDLRGPIFSLQGHKMTTPRSALEEKLDSIAVVLSSNSSFYLPLVVSGIKLKEVITKETLRNLQTRTFTDNEMQSMPCQLFTRVKVIVCFYDCMYEETY